MGFSGRILVARISEPYQGGDVAVLWEDERAHGWRWVQLDGDVPGALEEVVAASGAPAIAAYVLDSDVADVEALTPSGRRFHTYLHPRTAAQFGAPALSQSPDEVLAAALGWSAEAGLVAEPAAVRAALEAHSVQAEDTLAGLIEALGISEEV
ncbi:hypothetical protein Aab01nite_18850 [Paractinoplanes abujensis]|uniref:Uncharacterized protein n=1 Tax=Paractinoplanes abujensis TaxID=882441 RepID=A0A7W7CZ03_9ACTN|nr:hypothetical protein [Actinoplanes abujensis]MBB4697231.1 hypothetical protein [Actinoplanes abujensis]GID18295.1 hypothetical protein Aab01nite_18850 [Actinoplanes abujensis]